MGHYLLILCIILTGQLVPQLKAQISWLRNNDVSLLQSIETFVPLFFVIWIHFSKVNTNYCERYTLLVPEKVLMVIYRAVEIVQVLKAGRPTSNLKWNPTYFLLLWCGKKREKLSWLPTNNRHCFYSMET